MLAGLERSPHADERPLGAVAQRPDEAQAVVPAARTAQEDEGDREPPRHRADSPEPKQPFRGSLLDNFQTRATLSKHARRNNTVCPNGRLIQSRKL